MSTLYSYCTLCLSYLFNTFLFMIFNTCYFVCYLFFLCHFILSWLDIDFKGLISTGLCFGLRLLDRSQIPYRSIRKMGSKQMTLSRNGVNGSNLSHFAHHRAFGRVVFSLVSSLNTRHSYY